MLFFIFKFFIYQFAYFSFKYIFYNKILDSCFVMSNDVDV